MISTVKTRNAFITAENDSATSTKSVRMTSGWTRGPKRDGVDKGLYRNGYGPG